VQIAAVVTYYQLWIKFERHNFFQKGNAFTAEKMEELIG
jgi:hypothetical protein